MRSKLLSTPNARKRACRENEKSTAPTPGKDAASLKPGAITWVKLSDSKWWPAQVVNENTVSKMKKPRKRMSTGVLVRLYGSDEHLCVDPVRSQSEFDAVLKHHNGSHAELMKAALEQERAPSKRPRHTQAAKNVAKTESSPVVGSKERKKSKDENGSGNKKKLKLNCSNKGSSRQSPREPSERRLKVMKGLGLISPNGSPFHRNESNLDQMDSGPSGAAK